MSWRRVGFIVLRCLGGGCAALRGGKGGSVDGRLRVQMTDVQINGSAARLKGTVVNEFSEPVEGVRYVVLVRDPEEPTVVHERFDRQADTVIAAGGRADMTLDVEGESLAQPKFRIVITATPVKLGGRDVPPPAK